MAVPMTRNQTPGTRAMSEGLVGELRAYAREVRQARPPSATQTWGEVADNLTRAADRIEELERGWPISKDGPHEIGWNRRWLARQLMDSKLDEETALGIVSHFPGIRSSLRSPSAHSRPVEGVDAWRSIESAPRDCAILIGWWTADGVWTERRAWWDAQFEYQYDEDADETNCRGAWTDNAVQSFGYEEVQEYHPTHWRSLPSAPTEDGARDASGAFGGSELKSQDVETVQNGGGSEEGEA